MLCYVMESSQKWEIIRLLTDTLHVQKVQFQHFNVGTILL